MTRRTLWPQLGTVLRLKLPSTTPLYLFFVGYLLLLKTIHLVFKDVTPTLEANHETISAGSPLRHDGDA
jgi:hypothetical protein